MRYILAMWLALAGIAPAAAQLSFGFSSGGVSIGVNVPVYPSFVRIPGYPVYYAPGVATNYFFYDGLYWVFDNGEWYQSSWYNGPWYAVPPDAVPVFLLRVPVRYYRHPPAFFRGWRADAPPRWDEHWGRGWYEHHRDWNRWDRAHAPPPAPLPSYQRRYSGDRYPRGEAQAREHAREYHYQPRDRVVREHYERHVGPQAREQRGPEQRGPQQRAPEHRGPDHRGQGAPERRPPGEQRGRSDHGEGG